MSVKYSNNSDNSLTSRRTDGGKKEENPDIEHFFSLNCNKASTYIKMYGLKDADENWWRKCDIFSSDIS